MMIVAILQARMSSTRLPGKVLKPLAGAPSLARQLERLERSMRLDRLVVATSVNPEDEAIATLCADRGTACFRGSLSDVLDRVYQAALSQAPLPDHVVRLTADCPLTDWRLIDSLIEVHLKGGFDYSSNTIPRSYPKGLDAEIVTLAALEEAWRKAANDYQREHVTPYFYQAGTCETFRIGSERQEENWEDLRWTLDTPEDYDMISAVYDALYGKNPAFTTTDVMAFLLAEHKVATLNADAKALSLYDRLRGANSASATR